MTTRISTSNMDSLSSFANPQPGPNNPLRRGTWTAEEEQYVAALIEEFKYGHLPLKEGMSLRCFLAKMVHCNPKRISKKFEGSNYNGKQLYEQSEKELDPEEARLRQAKLQELEDKFSTSVEQLKATEETRRNGLMDQALSRSMNAYPQRERIPPSVGLRGPEFHGPGISSAETNWLRGSLAMQSRPLPPFGMGAGMGMNAMPSLAGAFDPALFHGYMDPIAPAGLSPHAMRELMMMQEYGRMPMAGGFAGEHMLRKKRFSDPALAAAKQAALEDYENSMQDRSYSSIVRARRSSLSADGDSTQDRRYSSVVRARRSSLSANGEDDNIPAAVMSDVSSSSSSSAGAPQPVRSSPLSNSKHSPAPEEKFYMPQHRPRPQRRLSQAEIHEHETRRRLMDVLSQPTSSESKRPSLGEGSYNDSKRRRMH